MLEGPDQGAWTDRVARPSAPMSGRVKICPRVPPDRWRWCPHPICPWIHLSSLERVGALLGKDEDRVTVPEPAPHLDGGDLVHAP